MSRRKKIPGWIVLNYNKQPAEFVCKRCEESSDSERKGNARRPVHLPAVIEDFGKQGEAFAESHRFCK